MASSNKTVMVFQTVGNVRRLMSLVKRDPDTTPDGVKYVYDPKVEACGYCHELAVAKLVNKTQICVVHVETSTDVDRLSQIGESFRKEYASKGETIFLYYKKVSI